MMWKCSNCNKENLDNQNRCICGYERTTEYTTYRTCTQMSVKEMENYSQQTFGNKTAKEWMDWAISVKQKIQDMDETVGKNVIEQMKKYFETITMNQIVHTFILSNKIEKDICDEEIKKQWSQIKTENLPEDEKWNLEGNLWLFGVGRPKDASKAVQAYIKSANHEILFKDGKDAVKEIVKGKMQLFGSSNKA